MAANRTAGLDSAKRRTKRRRELKRRTWRNQVRQAMAGGSALLSLMAAQTVYAAPEGQIVHGQGTIETVGNVTNINTLTHNTIFQGPSFDIAQQETVNVNQPGAMSRFLGRVESANPTNIFGELNSNGRVYIFNSAGVIFGESARVDVRALYAGAANLTNADFLNNIDHFTNVSGDVVNWGSIQADTVALIGEHVANYGSIATPANGMVTMVAGDDVLLSEQGGHIFVRIEGAADGGDGDASGGGDDPGVENDGTITSGSASPGKSPPPLPVRAAATMPISRAA